MRVAYFFFGVDVDDASLSSVSLNAPRIYLIESTILLASSGIFFAPKRRTATAAMIIISFVPNPNMVLYYYVLCTTC